MCFRPGELLVVAGLLVYGIGALGFLLGGTGFLLSCLVLALVAAPFAWLSVRARRKRLARIRAKRRAARIAAYREVWSYRDAA
jgi:membrane protein implicated in regulation of membrane protease activity